MTFDAYHKWLGITPEEQPVNHYRLLGIRVFEDDPDVIATAADRQMAHVRTFQTGRHSALSQRLLNDISRARVCLLNRDSKQTYDEKLQRELKPAMLPKKKSNPLLVGLAVAIAVLVIVAAIAFTRGPQRLNPRMESPAQSTPTATNAGQAVEMASAIPRKTAQATAKAGNLQKPAKSPLQHIAAAPEKASDPATPNTEPKPILPEAAPTTPQAPSSVASSHQNKEDAQQTRSGTAPDVFPLPDWIELLSDISLEGDRIEGKWIREGDSIHASASSSSNVSLPVELEVCSYDLQVEFTRNNGKGTIQIGLPVGKRMCTLALGGWSDAYSVLAAINGKDTPPEATRRPGTIVNGKRYAVLAKVRVDGEAVSVEVLVDGAAYLQWNGNDNQISVPSWSHPPYPHRPALGGGCADVTYHSAELRVLSSPTAKVQVLSSPPEASRAAETHGSEVQPHDPQVQGKTMENVVRITPALLRKKFRGRAIYDDDTRVLTLFYDFKNRHQLEDFEGKAIWNNGYIAVRVGDYAVHMVPFTTVTVSGIVAMKSARGALVETTGGFGCRRYDEGLGVRWPGNDVKNQQGPNASALIVPFEMLVSHKVVFRLGGGEVGKERADEETPVGQIKLCSGSAGAMYSNITITGEIDPKWAAEFFADGP